MKRVVTRALTLAVDWAHYSSCFTARTGKASDCYNACSDAQRLSHSVLAKNLSMEWLKNISCGISEGELSIAYELIGYFKIMDCPRD